MKAARDPLPEKWRRYRERPREERTLIRRAVVLLILTEFGFRVFGYQRWKKLFDHFSHQESSPVTDPAIQLEIAQHTVRAVRSAELHGLATPNCLERSLTLWWLLRRQGVGGELRIGARKNGSRLEAHAWVELNGQVLNDSPEVHTHYSRFDAPIAVAEVASSRAPVEKDSPATGKMD